MLQQKPILIITGPTASGKSDAALRIAEQKDGVIINADSKQVYKEIPITTAQPNHTNDLHFLYGYVNITSYYSVRIWLQDVQSTILSAWNKNKIAIIVGGSGMYINSLITGLSYSDNVDYDRRHELENQLKKIGHENFYNSLKKQGINLDGIHQNDSYRLIKSAEEFIHQRKAQRIKHHETFHDITLNILMPERRAIYKNIEERFIKMLKTGMIDELNSVQHTIKDEYPAVKACGLKEMLKYIRNEVSLSSAIIEAQQNTRRYAKRQMTWFRNQFPQANFATDCTSLLKLCL